MMPKTLINIRNLSVAYINRTILNKFSFSVIAGEIVVIVGANGCGKSTILKLLFENYRNNKNYLEDNQIQLQGNLELKNDIELSYLPQNLRLDWVENDKNSEDYSKISKVLKLNQKYKFDECFNSTDELSDGQLQKYAIIDILTSEADLFLLDEPTNYLDIDGLTALEDNLLQLKRENRAIVIVTHDRTLTDNVADRTIYISQNGIYECHGGYQTAWSLKTSDLESRKNHAKELKRRINTLQQDVRRRKGWSNLKEKQKIGAKRAKAFIAHKAKKMAKRAQAINKRVEKKIEELKQDKILKKRDINLSFPDYEIKHRNVFAVKNLSFSYSNEKDQSKYLLNGILLEADTTDKICLLGCNGSGKSTLFKLIMGELKPYSGSVYLHPNLNVQYINQGLIGYFKQNRLLDNFIGIDEEAKVRQYLGAALIRREKVTDFIENFSHGELMRAAIVKCILEKTEFLLLDEPTSYLDIESIEILESLLINYQGGFLIISHDRTFVSNVADKLYLLENNKIKQI